VRSRPASMSVLRNSRSACTGAAAPVMKTARPRTRAQRPRKSGARAGCRGSPPCRARRKSRRRPDHPARNPASRSRSPRRRRATARARRSPDRRPRSHARRNPSPAARRRSPGCPTLRGRAPARPAGCSPCGGNTRSRRRPRTARPPPRETYCEACVPGSRLRTRRRTRRGPRTCPLAIRTPDRPGQSASRAGRRIPQCPPGRRRESTPSAGASRPSA
jgi:hypothetical protein